MRPIRRINFSSSGPKNKKNKKKASEKNQKVVVVS